MPSSQHGEFTPAPYGAIIQLSERPFYIPHFNGWPRFASIRREPGQMQPMPPKTVRFLDADEARVGLFGFILQEPAF